MQYKDYENMSLPQVAWLLDVDPRDFPDNYISATTIIQPIKPLILSMKLKEEDREISLSGSYASRTGTAIHNDLEATMSKIDVLLKAGELLGIPAKVIENTQILTETRTEKAIGDWVITGEFDLVMDSMAQDYKTMSSYSYYKHNPEKFIKQLSVYQWLNPELITEPEGRIHYFITNFSPRDVGRDGFPAQKMFYTDYFLDEDIDTFLQSQIAAIDEHLHKSIEQLNFDLPECTPEHLDIEPSVFKYYANPDNTSRATKNFTTYFEADEHLKGKGKGIVVEVKGRVGGCKFCPAKPICATAQQFILEGILDEE